MTLQPDPLPKSLILASESETGESQSTCSVGLKQPVLVSAGREAPGMGSETPVLPKPCEPRS
eukprot:11768769-Karenia_brevis.AAC.1